MVESRITALFISLLLKICASHFGECTLIVYWLFKPSHDIEMGCFKNENFNYCFDYPHTHENQLSDQLNRIINLKYNEKYKDKCVIIVGPNYTNDIVELIKIMEFLKYPVILPEVSFSHLEKMADNLNFISVSASNKQQAEIICKFLVESKASDVSVIYTTGIYEIDLISEINSYMQSLTNYSIALGSVQVESESNLSNYEISSANFLLLILSDVCIKTFVKKLKLIDPSDNVTLIFTDLFTQEWNIFHSRSVFYAHQQNSDNWIHVLDNINLLILAVYNITYLKYDEKNYKKSIKFDEYLYSNFISNVKKYTNKQSTFVGQSYKIFFNHNTKPIKNFIFYGNGYDDVFLTPNLYQKLCQPICFDGTRKLDIDNVCHICQALSVKVYNYRYKIILHTRLLKNVFNISIISVPFLIDATNNTNNFTCYHNANSQISGKLE
ncbi:hypothetical protein A3Q56_04810 [Intoshia linei]|uniref:Receptor ligand binding region domain-containing protein n=1 Tax=Intoshia linei TaxID=1819745 RepID=A0A177AZJ3_9BILA|nr:hypothetical protein A3Q56_04810 [Intoshia linei]